MFPLSLIVNALGVGGATTAAGTAARDAYAKLKRLVEVRLSGNQAAEIVLAQHELDPERWAAPLSDVLLAAEVDTDVAVIEAAERVMDLVGQQDSQEWPDELVPERVRGAGDRPIEVREAPGSGTGGGPPRRLRCQWRRSGTCGGKLPERADVGRRIPLLVWVSQSGGPGASAGFRLDVPPEGRTIVVTVSAPGLVPTSDVEQELIIPADGDSNPVRFGFRTVAAGLSRWR